MKVGGFSMLYKKFLLCFFCFCLCFTIAFSYVALRHFVNSGDTVESICRIYQLPQSVFLDWNQSDSSIRLTPGMVVTIPFPSGFVYRVSEGNSLSWISCAFFSDLNTIASANGLKFPHTLRIGQEIFVPYAEVGRKFFNESDKLLWPVYGEISSLYGNRIHPITGLKSFHAGLDIAAPEGTPIFASASGTVTMAGENGGYGIMIEIESATQKYRYGHLSALCVMVGQRVKRGDVIGRIGSTGDSTGPHLHFEVRNQKNQTLDPLSQLPNIKNIYPKH